MNNSQKRAVVRAYKQGMTLPNIALLFKSSYQTTISIVHDYMVKGVRYVWLWYARVAKAISILGWIVLVYSFSVR